MRRLMMVLLAGAAVLSGCTMDSPPESGGSDVLRLAAHMDGAAPPRSVSARSTYSDTGGFFAANAQVSVVISNATISTREGTHTFKADGSNPALFSPVSSLYWGEVGAQFDAYAYYPVGAYTFPVNQSTEGNLASADYLFAEKVTGITKANFNTDKEFTFKHKTAKVKARLIQGTVADITGATVTFYGYTTASSIDNSGGTPTGAITGSGSGEITPYNNSGVHTALLIPWTYTDVNLLKVSINGKDYFWKPASQQLEAGHSYDLEITVNETLSVSVTNNGAAWTDSGNPQTVTPDAAVIDVSRSDLSGGVGWTYADNTFTVTQFGAYTFTGTSGQNKIKVNSGVTAFITLDNTVLTNGNFSGAGATVHLQLKNTNSLKGVHIPSGSAITIYGTGSLATVGGGYGAAGIGGESGQAGGVITINGGTITANAGTVAAGIGGGYQGEGGTITINGGKVTAIGGQYNGAGIGGGRARGAGTIVINGGTVTATGYNDSIYNDIGHSVDGGNGTTTITGGSVLGTTGYIRPQPKNSSGTEVWRTKLTVGSVPSGTSVTALTITYGGVSYPYNFKDMEIGSSNDVYLWLPAGNDVNISLDAGGPTYSHTPNVTVTNDNTSRLITLNNRI